MPTPFLHLTHSFNTVVLIPTNKMTTMRYQKFLMSDESVFRMKRPVH